MNLTYKCLLYDKILKETTNGQKPIIHKRIVVLVMKIK